MKETMKTRIPAIATATVILTLLGGGMASAAHADTTTEVASSASTPTTQEPTSPSADGSATSGTPTSDSPGTPTSEPAAPTPGPSPAATPQPTAPASPTPVSDPTPSPTSGPAEPAPVSTTAPAPKPEPVVTAPLYTVVLWEIDPSGDTHLPQKYIASVTTTTPPADLTSLFPGKLKCGIKYQVDAYLPHDGVQPSTLWVTGYLLDGHDGAFLAYGLPFTPYIVLTAPDCIKVTATEPTVTPICRPAGGGYNQVTLPKQEGVIYTIDAPGMNKIIVTATAKEGYVLTGTTKWFYSNIIVDENIVCPAPPVVVTPPTTPKPPTHPVTPVTPITPKPVATPVSPAPTTTQAHVVIATPSATPTLVASENAAPTEPALAFTGSDESMTIGLGVLALVMLALGGSAIVVMRRHHHRYSE